MEYDVDREMNREHEDGAKGSPRMAEKVLQEALTAYTQFSKTIIPII